MNAPLLVPLLGAMPTAGEGLCGSPSARIIGRATVGRDCELGAFATLRADGERVIAGDRCWFGDRATAHIAHDALASRIGDDVTVGRLALVHAAEIGDGSVLCEGAVVMDGARVGKGAVIAAQSLVPPRKTVEAGWLYAGVPAAPVRQLREGELEEFRRIERQRKLEESFQPASLERLHLPSAGRSFVADTARIEAPATLENGATVWFGTRIAGRGGKAIVGAQSNVQDNTFVNLADGETIEIGQGVTVGHNAILEACRIEDGALVGMGAVVGRGSVIEEGACLAGGAIAPPGSVITRGMLWAGRPARAVRPVSESERAAFGRGVKIYSEEYLKAFLNTPAVGQ